MEMNSADILCVKMQEKLTVLLKNTIDFLEKNNLRWWMAYGSAIGTVRHHGFIPWDDDLDLFMPFEDYEKMLQIKDFNKFDLALDIPFSANNCCSYAKIYDTKSTIWQEEDYESIIGVWIDIFPLYQTDMTEIAYWENVDKYRKLQSKYLSAIRKPKLDTIKFLVCGFHLNSIRKWIYDMTIAKFYKKSSIEEFEKFISSLNNIDGRYYVFPFTYSNIVNLFPVEWFEDTLLMPFEGLSVKIMGGYDKILHQLYGDYMKLPPIEKQKAHHPMYYCNLREHLTIEEVRKRIAKGEKYVM